MKGREHTPFAELAGSHLRERLPTQAVRQTRGRTDRKRLSACHFDIWIKLRRQIVALFQEFLLGRHHFRFIGDIVLLNLFGGLHRLFGVQWIASKVESQHPPLIRLVLKYRR